MIGEGQRRNYALPQGVFVRVPASLLSFFSCDNESVELSPIFLRFSFSKTTLSPMCSVPSSLRGMLISAPSLVVGLRVRDSCSTLVTIASTPLSFSGKSCLDTISEDQASVSNNSVDIRMINVPRLPKYLIRNLHRFPSPSKSFRTAFAKGSVVKTGFRYDS